ncbi:hypothetical protein KMW28_16735 [Flammeovirga yaeyamensis]|uniref:Uncharacterized protein n=2 Tax=Flammeovirgaceae TaxID=200667 RepID=A0AAX1N1D0_9BACT|nr:hypothetical protein [Flammeovirga yaeyamensis]ANQ51285.2 hypothetical protein MY04_3941 [Flammeovirga sp. MY04]MBB3698339.1 hypothetical protein [Flammeovirga yaeyamensis]NMF34308.1 hypothetical protein [Flammeovirga yaeyamensis]QWG01291.1 hypothetical protein KMW28_16735 [Flammeovirga yaeyamensis]
MFLLFGSTLAHAQYYDDEQMIEDPLVKPHIWSQLKENPTDENLWVMYFGKDLFDITAEEYQLYEILKKDLLNADKDFQAQQEQAKINRALSRAQVTQTEYEDWTRNINLNFGQIELYFTDKFSELGSEYVPYSELYEEGEYNLTQWVDEHESRLKELQDLQAINNGDY